MNKSIDKKIRLNIIFLTVKKILKNYCGLNLLNAIIPMITGGWKVFSKMLIVVFAIGV